MPRRSLVLSATLVAALVLGTPVLGKSEAAKLNGTVGPGFSISLKDAKGHAVKTLRAGTYTFAISDKASIHDFTLEQEKGGKFEKHLTSVPFTGSKTVTVTLKKGKYKYYCSAHEATIFAFFAVT